MQPVEGEPGMFTFTFVPEDFFLGTPSNIDQTPYTGELLENGVRWYITKPGYTFAGPPPSNSLGIPHLPISPAVGSISILKRPALRRAFLIPTTMRHLLLFLPCLLASGAPAPPLLLPMWKRSFRAQPCPCACLRTPLGSPFSDFCTERLPDSAIWIPSRGQGRGLKSTEGIGGRGIWIPGQPDAGFGALELRLDGRGAHVPILASTTRRITYTLASDYSSHEDVRIMGAFNGWSRTSHPLAQRPVGQWTIDLELGEGQHAYQLIVDGEEMPDPANPDRVDNGFGGFNSLLTVEGPSSQVELSAIGFGGNQVHDVRLLGTPGARVWAWEDHLYTSSQLGENGSGLVRIPAAAYAAGRTKPAPVGHRRGCTQCRGAHSSV